MVVVVVVVCGGGGGCMWWWWWWLYVVVILLWCSVCVCVYVKLCKRPLLANLVHIICYVGARVPNIELHNAILIANQLFTGFLYIFVSCNTS